MIRVAVTGVNGRIGSKIIKTIVKEEDMEVVAAIGSPNTPLEGKDVGGVIGVGKMDVPLNGAQKLAEVLNETKPDVLIDFTVADAAVNTIKISAECGVDVVVGTTGFSEEQLSEIKESIEKNKIKAVISPSMNKKCLERKLWWLYPMENPQKQMATWQELKSSLKLQV